ncbi:unnamed protein product [Larinioides sclopetarius]|uniref:Uncharacterized protein n=1 Tax=Larinioides sclopetarius TaxID=280406 RepID=A0AAV2B5W8_9ARAC
MTILLLGRCESGESKPKTEIGHYSFTLIARVVLLYTLIGGAYNARSARIVSLHSFRTTVLSCTDNMVTSLEVEIWRHVTISTLLNNFPDVSRNKRFQYLLNFLTRYNEEDDAMSSQIITGDKTWVSHITPERKQQSMEWRRTTPLYRSRPNRLNPSVRPWHLSFGIGMLFCWSTSSNAEPPR